jgi:formylglycine-generating enzyme required for sulfatase activity
MSSLSDQLHRLREALRAGDLTSEEFELFKEDLLRQARAGSDPAPSPGSEPRRTAEEPTQEQIGAYRLLGELGRGGMGVVYRARHRLDSKARQQGGEVALKLMHAQLAGDAEYRARFEREATLGLELSHPGIVRVFDLVEDSGRLGLVMELVQGQPLSELLRCARPPWQQGVPRFDEVLNAVRAAHNEGVIHRDLKPANIMVTSDGRWKVTDFGLAKQASHVQMGLTTTSRGMGSVAYMAPEQARDARSADHRADIYALGLILYELLTGDFAWERASSPFQLDDWKREEKLVDPQRSYPDAPAELVAVAWQAARYQPSARYSSMSAMQTALRLAMERARLQAELTGSVVAVDREREELAAQALREAEERKRAEERARRAEEEAARREAETKAKREAQEAAQREAAARARQEAEAKARREAEAKARREAEREANRVAEKTAEQEAATRAQQEAEERARRVDGKKARLEAEAQARRLAEERTQRETTARVRYEAEAKARREAEEKARREAEALGRDEEMERAPPTSASTPECLAEAEPEDPPSQRRGQALAVGRVALLLGGTLAVLAGLVGVVALRARIGHDPEPSPPSPAGIDWVSIPGGSFEMGSPPSEEGRDDDEGPLRAISVGSLEMSRSEVTVAQYRACVEAGACSTKNLTTYDSCNWGKSEQEEHPITCVDWEQASGFARWVGGRLPTEAEWEYAARKPLRFRYAGSNALDSVAWYSENSNSKTQAVCEKVRNGYGLCDMSGNVWEWVEDWYHDSYELGPTDGSAWLAPKGAHRILRGGSWNNTAGGVRVANRAGLDPRLRSGDLGFRVVRSNP